jgi:hypothetical protein
MSFISTPGVNPLIIASEASSDINSVAVVLSASVVYLYAFEVQAPLSIASVRWGMGATVTGTTNMGIYTAAGNLVAGSDTTAKTNVASSTNVSTYGTPVYLPAGQYYLALACSNATDTYNGKTLSIAFSTSRHRRGANALAAGALPSTLGAISTTTITLGVAAVPVGGLV